MRHLILLLLLAIVPGLSAATPVGINSILPVNHSYLDTNGNPETLSVVRLRVLDGSSNVLDSTEVAAAPSPGPTNVPLADVIDFPGASGATVTLEAQVVDAAGNPSVWASFGQIAIDDTPPQAPTFGTIFNP